MKSGIPELSTADLEFLRDVIDRILLNEESTGIISDNWLKFYEYNRRIELELSRRSSDAAEASQPTSV